MFDISHPVEDTGATATLKSIGRSLPSVGVGSPLVIVVASLLLLFLVATVWVTSR